MKQHIADFLKFLESKENRKVPLVAKIRYPDKVGPLTKEDLFIDGDLDLRDAQIESLPDNLTVRGHLTIANYNIKSLPDNLTVGGDLDLSYGSKITSLPNNLKVGGDLEVYGTMWGGSIGWNLSKQQIRQEIERKGGYIKGEIKNTIWYK